MWGPLGNKPSWFKSEASQRRVRARISPKPKPLPLLEREWRHAERRLHNVSERARSWLHRNPRYFVAIGSCALPAYITLDGKGGGEIEYPGMHIPAPLELGTALPTDINERAKEILTLTKMNWNSSDGISRVPITIQFARRVGELMCELSENATPKPSYRFYI